MQSKKNKILINILKFVWLGLQLCSLLFGIYAKWRAGMEYGVEYQDENDWFIPSYYASLALSFPISYVLTIPLLFIPSIFIVPWLFFTIGGYWQLFIFPKLIF